MTSDLDPRKLLLALRYALAGLGSAWRTERAFRQEVVAALILGPVALWLGENGVERALLVGSLLLVLLTELLNTAIETLVERISPAHHPLSGRAKDLGSAAVLVAIVTAAVVWGLVLTH